MDSREPINELDDADFANQMELLIEQAKQQKEESPLIAGEQPLEKAVRDLGKSVETIQKMMTANSALLEKLGTKVEKEEKNSDSTARRESVNQQMFDALYEEMKGYKDSFLMEALFKPVVRDLITLYDDTTKIHEEVAGFVKSKEKGAKEREVFSYLKNTVVHLDHMNHFLLELMERMGITKMPSSDGKFDKNKQRVLSVESVDSSEEDGMIVRSMKPGFMWRDRVVRPEEVVIKRCKK